MPPAEDFVFAFRNVAENQLVFGAYSIGNCLRGGFQFPLLTEVDDLNFAFAESFDGFQVLGETDLFHVDES